MTRLTAGVAAGVVVLGAGLAAGLVHATGLAAKPRAVVVYHVATEQPTILGGGGGAPLPAYKEIQAALVTSRRTLAEVLKDPKVKGLGIVPADDPIEWLRDRLTVDPRGTSEFFSVTIEGAEPAELLELLGAVDRAYRDASYQRDNARQLERRSRLEREHNAARAEVKDFNDRIDAIARQLGSKNADVLALMDKFRQAGLEAAIAKLSAARDDLAAAKTALDAAKAQARDLARRPAVAAFVGASWLATLGRDPKPVQVDPAQEEFDRLVAESRKAAKKIEDVERELDQRNRYKIDLETLQKEIASREQLSARLYGELETMRVEGNAAPRVTVAEEPFILRTARGQDPTPQRVVADELRTQAAAAGPGWWAWVGVGLCGLVGGFLGAAAAVRSSRGAARPAPAPATDYSGGVS
ncbi:MAG: hypothetical protein C0501_08410 [Isosphaera sp.]|nr:hypothetical protein [Isosphaera sp.]